MLARTFEGLALVWAPTHDDVAVDYYEVFLNSYLVGTAKPSRAVVPWLEDSITEFILTVRAVDTAGNPGEPSVRVPVIRPDPSPSPSPSATGVSAMGRPTHRSAGPDPYAPAEGTR